MSNNFDAGIDDFMNNNSQSSDDNQNDNYEISSSKINDANNKLFHVNIRIIDDSS